MARPFLAPVQLPGDPTADLHAVPRQFVTARTPPPGGNTGQVLRKTSPADFAFAWQDAGLGGVVDCSGMTTAAAINAASAAAPPGSTIWLGPRPAGAELVLEETLVIRPNQRLLGAGGRARLTRLVAGPSFPAGQPLVAAQGYLANATLCDSPVVVAGLDIDCAGKVGSHGLVVFHFWSLFDDLQVHNCTGTGVANVSSAAAILLANRGIDGTTVTENSHSENVLRNIRINASAAGATGILQQSFTSAGNGGAANQDGHLLGCWIAGGGAVGGGRGFEFARAAGWSMRDVHMYGIGDDAARLLACYATDLDGWYIENYGNNDTAADNYAGLQCEFLRGRGSTLSNIKVSSSQSDNPAAGRLTNFHLRAGSGQLNAMVTVVGCHSNLNRTSAPPTRKTQAWRLGESGDTGRSLYIRMAGNLTDPLDGWMSPARFIHPATIVLDEDGTKIPRTVVFSATPSIDPTQEGDRVKMVATADVTALGVSTTGARDGQVLQLTIPASGATRAVTFASAIRTSTGVSRGPYSVPLGQMLRASVEYSADLAAWSLLAAAVTAT
jgi:hypothetical protein